MDLVSAQCKTANNQPVTANEPKIRLSKECERPVRKIQINSNMTLLSGSRESRVLLDLITPLQLPVHIIPRPDTDAWSDLKKCIHQVVLTVPWEVNREEAHERKKNCSRGKVGTCYVLPNAVGCLGLLERSIVSYLLNVGITSRCLKGALKFTAQLASSWNWPRSNINRVS